MVKKINQKNQEIVSASYAKINLILNIESKLEDGYNKLRTVFSLIDLKDTIKYSLTKSNNIEVLSNIEGLCGQVNLVHTVATYLKDKYSVNFGVKIFIDKCIPIAAGLGGGSSNAANAIKALNELWKLNLSHDEMNDIASRFGSDINFFLDGKTAIGYNRGEIIENIAPIKINYLLLVKPKIGISSKEAYQLVEKRGINPDFNEFLNTLDYNLLFNDLQVGISKKYKIIKKIINEIRSNGAIKSQMSGSGSTCFGIFDDFDKITKAYDYFKNDGYWVNITKTI